MKKPIKEECGLKALNPATGVLPTSEGVTLPVVVDLSYATLRIPTGVGAVGPPLVSPKRISTVFYGGTPAPVIAGYLSPHTSVRVAGLPTIVAPSGSTKKDVEQMDRKTRK